MSFSEFPKLMCEVQTTTVGCCIQQMDVFVTQNVMAKQNPFCILLSFAYGAICPSSPNFILFLEAFPNILHLCFITYIIKILYIFLHVLITVSYYGLDQRGANKCCFFYFSFFSSMIAICMWRQSLFPCR